MRHNHIIILETIGTTGTIPVAFWYVRIAWLPVGMDHLIFTPWRDNEEILIVRRWLFPAKGSKDPDRRRKACSRVSEVQIDAFC